MGPTPSSGAAADAPAQCQYTVRESRASSERLTAIRADLVQQWLTQSFADRSAPCATQLARLAPEFAEGEAIPNEEALRAAVRELARASGRDSLVWEMQHDGNQLRAHVIADAIARRGWNAHKLFAIGNLVGRDIDGRYFRRGGMLSDGTTTSDANDARRWTYHPAVVVLLRIDGRESASFACPDDREQRCAFRVIDPTLRTGRASATTDDAMGLFSVRDWLRALRPLDAQRVRGVSIELARRAQMTPASMGPNLEASELFITESEQCPVGLEALSARRSALRASRHGDATAGYRQLFALRAASAGQPAEIEIEGVDEPLFVRDPAVLAALEQARSRNALVSVTYADADAVARAVRIEESSAPSHCLRAAITLGD